MSSPGLFQDGAAVGVWELDPATCVLESRVKHFWGAINVRGRFGAVTGHVDVAASGAGVREHRGTIGITRERERPAR
jgi:polyisoprenoid-binding protein YceI